MQEFKFYVIKNSNNEFYIGHTGRFSNDISKARLFKSEKTAIRHLYVEDYNDLFVLEVKFLFDLKNEIKITEEAYKTYNNYNYESWIRKQKSVSK